MNKELSKEDLELQLERKTKDCKAWCDKVNELYNQRIELQKENKELKEKVTELEGVIAKLSQKVILYECNY